MNLQQYSDEKRNKFLICKNIDKCLAQLQYEQNTAVAVSRHHANNCPLISSDKIFCFDRAENIGSFSVFMLMRENFEFNPQINKLIRYAMEGGLLEKWRADSTMNYKFQKEKGVFKALSIEHLGVGWLVILFGSIASFLTLLIEKFLHYKVLTSRSRFWIYGEYFFDGARHF